MRIIDLRTGRDVCFDEMVADLATVRVVYVGEEHDQAAHHEVERRVLAALIRRWARPSLGMEMFQRPFQSPLDDYIEGQIDEAELLRKTEYHERWGFDFGLYRGLLTLARSARIRVVALNAAREITRAVGRGGLEALSDAQRASLPELDLTDARHRALVRQALGDHPGMDEARIERFYVAQVIWDETMAQTVAETLRADPGSRMVVVAGALHVWGALGIPQRAARRGAEPYRIVLPVAEDSEEARFDGPPEERPADYLWVLPEAGDGEELPHRNGGVM